jgi:hypothetical protein
MMQRFWVTCGVGAAVSFLAPAARAAYLVRQVPLDKLTTITNSGGGTVANQLENITEGENLLAGSNGFVLGTPIGSASPQVINYARGGDADFAGGLNFPTGNGTLDQDDFALDAVAQLTYNVAGSYVFRVNTDDGFRLRTGVTPTGSGNTISAIGGTTYSEFIDPRGPSNTDGAALARTAGSSDVIRLTFFERGGGEEVEFSYSLNGGAFQLVGAGPDITVVTVPEPGALSLLGVGAIGVLRRRRRTC